MLVIAKDLVSNRLNNQFYKSDLDCDLDFDPMTLVLKPALDVAKMYHHTKYEVSMPRHSKVIARTVSQTDRQADSMKTLPSRLCGW